MLSKDFHEETTFSFSDKAPKPPERRREPRHLTILRVGTLIGPNGRELCLIRNISAGGLMAHVYSQHRVGEKISVEIKSDHEVPGSVKWCRESNVGIEFDAQIDVAEMLTSQNQRDSSWRQRMPRIEVDRLATVRIGARICGANTLDISQGGVKLETDVPIEVGEQVVITLDRLRPIKGVVRWQNGSRCGIAFHETVPFGELMGWLKGE